MSRLPQLPAMPSLHEHASCRCGGVWLYSISPTLILSLDCMTLTYANGTWASSEAVFILSADGREAKISSWHYRSLWLRMQVARVPRIWVLANTPFLLKGPQVYSYPSSILIRSALHRQDLATVISCLNVGLVPATSHAN